MILVCSSQTNNRRTGAKFQVVHLYGTVSGQSLLKVDGSDISVERSKNSCREGRKKGLSCGCNKSVGGYNGHKGHSCKYDSLAHSTWMWRAGPAHQFLSFTFTTRWKLFSTSASKWSDDNAYYVCNCCLRNEGKCFIAQACGLINISFYLPLHRIHVN